MKTRILLIVAAIGWAACAQAETVYNAATDFSLASNPNGVWSYGLRDGTAASSFAAFNTPETMGSPTDGLVKWDNNGVSDPSICYNPTANSYNVAAWGGWNCDAGEIVLNPYGVGAANRLGIRWTAPSAGTIMISAAFSPSQTVSDATKAFVYGGGSLGNTTLWESVGQVTATQSYSSFSALTVATGDTIDFAVDGATWKSMGCSAQVAFTAVPEPATLVSAASGLIGLLAYAWRKRQ